MIKDKINLLLHCSLLLIIIGGFVTFFTKEEGMLHLRQGRVNNELPIAITLERFEIEAYEGTLYPKDYISTVRVDGRQKRISMNAPLEVENYRLFQSDYDPDFLGSYLLFTYDPYGEKIVYVGYAILAICLIINLFRRRLPLLLYTLIFTMWIILIIVFIHRLNHAGETAMMPVLHSYWMPFHVGTIIVSYTLFGVAMIVSLVSLVRKKYSALSMKLVFPGLVFLCIGTMLGSVWASVSWGTYWSWDPKETWALITALIYATVLHTQHHGWIKTKISEKTTHLFIVLAFLSVLMTYYGVNHLLGGMHSYNG